ncbi:MAG TPA: DUF2784 domain-containing protein [Candidatus Paceibacterota bacterium]|nr:DUF2784 domain-containing protein [Verrucomicrobiota bacterium]HSA10777.1 DUF2784 domain-containing protein [Candidatus Paceibacterota bacterium]
MTLLQRLWLALADLALVVHATFVAFVVVGLVVIWVGRFRGWAFVRNFWFRAGHLAAIGVVAVESVGGCACPLTTWENRLRLMAGSQEHYAGSFIQHWLHRVIFFEFDQWIFSVAYAAFFLAVVLSFWLIPPRWPRAGQRPT